MPAPHEITSQVISVLGRIKGTSLANVPSSSRLIDDLGFKSVEIVQLMIEIQSEFGIAFASDDYVFENFSDVNSIVELVERYRRDKSHAV